MGDSAFTPRTRCRRAGCIQRCLSGSGGGGWIPLVTRGWPPTSCAGGLGFGAEVGETEACLRRTSLIISAACARGIPTTEEPSREPRLRAGDYRAAARRLV